jgi:hypothetical protein
MAATVIQQTEALPTTHRSGLAVLGAAAGIGATASLLIPIDAYGFGFPLVVLAAFIASRLLTKATATQPTPAAQWLWVPILLFSACLGWRDAESLRFLNLCMTAMFVGVLAIRCRPGILAKGTVFDYPLRAFGAWGVAMIDAILLVANDIAWRLIPQNSHGRMLGAMIRGMILAIPLLIVFGLLFASADAGFEGMFTGIRLDADTIVQQSFVGGVFAWLAAGFFRRIYITQTQTPDHSDIQPSRDNVIGGTELSIVLGSLNVLFILFVASQARYFFGGAEVVQTTEGLGIAEFARRGFFELVAVTGLALPTLLGLHALIDPKSARMRRIYKVLASTLVALLAVVMVSAAMKMKLYMDAYNLTTLRLYVAACLGWLAVVFAWFAFTVLRDRESRFAWGGVVTLAAAVFSMNIFNPDGFVARWNVAHSQNRQVDWNYLSQLSADASPYFAGAPANVRKEHGERLAGRRAHGDWRSRNLSLLTAPQFEVRNR